ncbi:MAG TPA: fused MFS/spermidine synthase [Phenylobacterium sp.]|uniref:fused MFS/spermidine synthase n=1 Tax=Phenylobacterium sp. TaxID=1871053 RepID=UPI002C5678E4|nr:fused MFS/spermidine synthase [Phenylobacterium sp.]HSV04343.1 fused MFS/spermidine synthase [Phenylobacterium sp.]
MTTLAIETRALRAPPALFAVTVFASAALVFMVEPMLAKLVLPLLGGSPSVWNTSLAFFQAALLAGYAYAHLLQKVRSVRTQAAIHLALVAAAALVLPLRVHELFGPPSWTHPALWLLGVLAASIGPPFAILSATAPLAQAWHARIVRAEAGKEPYVLYAASNLGSLIALLAYPIVVEPVFTVRGQTLGWSAGYVAFALLLATLAIVCARAPALAPEAPAGEAPAAAVTWRERLTWLALAAIPSSLMLGVTTHLTTDVASAPFLWVAPLALYLITFIIAFQARPAIPRGLALMFQAAAVAGCAALLPFKASGFLLQLSVHLAAFFFTALVCHQALVARRPPAARLTEFYLWLSIGGVVGGGFNAFLAPVIFDNVWEYPLVLTLACLARPSRQGDLRTGDWLLLVLGVIAGVAAPVLVGVAAPHLSGRHVIGSVSELDLLVAGARTALGAAAISAFLIRDRALLFCAVIAVLSIGAQAAADRVDTQHSWRSFFGVLRESVAPAAALGGEVRMLAHGSTLHGAQAVNPKFRCRPLVYYTPSTPIGQVFVKAAAKPNLRIGAVGLGTGSVAAYVRPGDHLTFFEIDPLVIRIATDPKYFSYTTECAKGRVDYVVGDARLTLAKQPPGVFDILLIDAFSSDAVPAHLLTVEAVRGYLSHIKPDGVVILHLSNRNLDLKAPAMAVARVAGAAALLQEHVVPPGGRAVWESGEDALVLAKSRAALAGFRADKRWKPIDPLLARAWTDDYTNVPGALYRRLQEKITWLP